MKLRKITIWTVSLLTLFTLVVLPTVVLAQQDPYGLGYLEKGDITLTSRDIRETIAQVINVIMGFLGTVAVVIVLIGGFQWMTAGGNEEKVGSAKKILMQGIIGLVIVLAAYSIATFVLTGLMEATS